MKYRVAFAGDLHKRHKDISTIRGYVKCCDLIQDELIKFFIDKNITHFVSLGDWYDRGYVDDVTSALADVTKDEYMSKVLNGNFYGVIGNHIRLNLDSNPELVLMQPSKLLKSRKPVKREEPIIKTDPTIKLGKVQISLVHHIPHAKSIEDYYIPRLDNVKYHIACVHDPRFIPNAQLSKTSHPTTSSMNTQISKVLEEVDLCICGDIHQPLGLFDVSPKTKMVVPGSLTNTNSAINGRHDTINIPIIDIDTETDTISYSFYPFNLHLNTLEFTTREEVKSKKYDKLSTLRGNYKEDLYDNIDNSVSFMTSGLTDLSLSKFLSEKGYKDSDKKLMQSVLKNPKDVIELVVIHVASDTPSDI